jgi:hypothetical protein
MLTYLSLCKHWKEGQERRKKNAERKKSHCDRKTNRRKGRTFKVDSKEREETTEKKSSGGRKRVRDRDGR